MKDNPLPFELPEWFDPSFYESCKEFSVHEWCWALNTRGYLWQQMRQPGGSDAPGMEPTFGELYSVGPSRRPHPPAVDKRCNFFHRSVTPFVWSNLAATRAECLGHPKVQKYKERVLSGSSRDLSRAEAKEYLELMSTPVDFLIPRYEDEAELHDLAHFVADLDMPDSVLVEHFKECLTEMRAQLKPRKRLKRFTRKDFSEWAAKKVLLYIDLTILANHYGKKITYQAMGLALFPDEYQIALSERVRNTTKKLAEDLMCDSTLHAINRQIYPSPFGA